MDEDTLKYIISANAKANEGNSFAFTEEDVEHFELFRAAQDRLHQKEWEGVDHDKLKFKVGKRYSIGGTDWRRLYGTPEVEKLKNEAAKNGGYEN